MKRYSETDGIERRLEAVGHAQRRQALLQGVVAGGVWLLIGLAVLFLLDWATHLPFVLRPGLAVVLIAYLVWAILRPAWRRYQAAVDAEGVSLAVEKAHPELQSRLISTLQFQAQGTLAKSVSENLVEGLVRQTFERVGSWSFGDVIDRSWWRKLAPLLSIAAAAVLIQVLIVPHYTTAFYQRLVMPSASYPTRTNIISVVGWQQVAEGDSTRLTVTARDELPPVGRATLTSDDGTHLALELKPTFTEVPADGEATYITTIPAIIDPADITIELGDDEWGPERIVPVPRIRLERIALTVTPPAYTGQDPQEIEGGNGRALLGSEVTIDVITTKDVAELNFVSFADEVPAPTAEAVGPRHYRATFTMTANLPFSLELSDHDGLEARGIPRYRIAEVRDRPPVIRVRRPASGVELAPTSRLPLEFSVTDDFGLKDVAIKYRVLDARTVIPEDVPEQVYGNFTPSGTTLAFNDLWDNRKLTLTEGNQVRVWIEATDRSPEAQVTESSTFVIQVISAEAYKQQLWSRLGEQIQDVGTIIPDIQDSQRSLERLNEK